MKKRSLFFRNFVNTSIIVIISFVLLGSIFSFSGYRTILNSQRENMTSTCAEIVHTLSAFRKHWELEGFETRMITTSLASTSHLNILITDSDGTVVSCSDTDLSCEHMGRNISVDTLETISGDVWEMPKAPKQKSQNFRMIRTDLDGLLSRRYNAVCQRIIGGGMNNAIQGYVIVYSTQYATAVMWDNYASIYVLLALIVLLLTFAMTYFTTRRQSEPIKQMAQAANNFARGDYGARVEYNGMVDEIAALTNSFNTMAESIEHSENMRREFVANVSHELKTPMTSIAGFADGILDGTIPPAKQGEYLAIISSETKRLSRLVRSMLDMSQMQAQEPGKLLSKSFDLCEVMCQALLSLEHKITAKKLDVDAQIPEEPIIVRGEKDSINQVIYNLIDNAAKFAPSGTTLKLMLWKQGAKAYVSVENHGETISEEELPLIFDRFHKTDKSRSLDRDGVGLGLYIVKTIINNHGEDIFVTSRDGVTKFTFTMTVVPNEK